MNYLFDMDGTLTDARQPIDPSFANDLKTFALHHSCYLVTGSDFPKVDEQLGAARHFFKAVFTSSGNFRYWRDGRTEQSTWRLTPQQRRLLEDELDRSEFWLRTGNHIEERTGSVNFSIVGRNATPKERGYYKFWDEAHNERQNIIKRLAKRRMMEGIELVCGGETSIDIFPRGFSKAQVRQHIPGPVTFIGDRTAPGGNDHDIAKLCETVVTVKNWQETAAFLLTIK